MTTTEFHKAHAMMQQATAERAIHNHKTEPDLMFRSKKWTSERVEIEYPMHVGMEIRGFLDVCEIYHHYREGTFDVHFQVYSIFPAIKSVGHVMRSLKQTGFMIHQCGVETKQRLTSTMMAVVMDGDPMLSHLKWAATNFGVAFQVLKGPASE